MEKTKNFLDNIPDDFPKDQPVVMLNLLKWNKQAQYLEGSRHFPAVAKKLGFGLAAKYGGLELLYLGLPASMIIGEDCEKWDAVALVKYPNIETFHNAISSDEYAATALEHRDAALKDWKLIATTEVKLY
ncbi:hypothetical protein N7530_010829 [Penicillium desertorum]|uniref:DUF1330 domain-containing protein n=1 Tax=Penicillium desertorum TaxID=1303715 RepID=A0A9X0BH21_9EURO|nr:hypothetical protein N7530_010829 [Penicillium desertorum]